MKNTRNCTIPRLLKYKHRVLYHFYCIIPRLTLVVMYELVVYSDNSSKEVGKYFYFDTVIYVLSRYPNAITGFKIELV